MGVERGAAPSGGALVAGAALAALQLAQGRSADETALLGAFFTLLGDNLALLSLGQPDREDG